MLLKKHVSSPTTIARDSNKGENSMPRFFLYSERTDWNQHLRLQNLVARTITTRGMRKITAGNEVCFDDGIFDSPSRDQLDKFFQDCPDALRVNTPEWCPLSRGDSVVFPSPVPGEYHVYTKE